MREYRLYFQDARGRLQRIEAIHAANDAAAVSRAEVRHHPYPVEVTCGPRKVGNVGPGISRPASARAAWE